MAYIETSAKDGVNVDKAFETMCNAIFEKMKNYINSEFDELEQATPSISIATSNESKETKKGCC